MVVKLLLWSLAREDADPKFIGPLDCQDNDSYAVLRLLLEEADIVDWPFSFWDPGSKCRINLKLERFNKIASEAFIIPQEQQAEIDVGTKRKRLSSPSDLPSCDEDIEAMPHLDLEGTAGPDFVSPELDSGGGSSSETMENDMISTLLSTEVLEKYKRAVEKLKAEMKRMSIDDHMWCLKSWDQDGSAIVKLYCGECSKLYGSNEGDHNKITIANLFANFSKKHLVSAGHIKNWCRRKGLDYNSHPQSESKDKVTILTAADHKRLVEEGVTIMDLINDSVEPDRSPFSLIGDRHSPHMRSFWMKVKCNFCGDFFYFVLQRRT